MAVELERLRGVKITKEDGSTVTHDQQLQWLHFCVTGLNHPIQLPSNPMYIDSLIGGQELYPGVVPKIGRNFIQVVAIEGFPLESYPGILSVLAELPIEYRWSSRFIFLDHHEAVSHLEKFRKKWKQKMRGFFDQVFNTNTSHIDEDAVSMVADASSAIAETNSGLVSQGYYTSVVVLMNESREQVEQSARRLEKAINALAFTARVETINTMDAYFGSLPGHGVENVRRPLLNTMNLADLLPTSTIWTGENRAPSPLFPPNAPPLLHGVTSGNSPMRINLHVRDLGTRNTATTGFIKSARQCTIKSLSLAESLSQVTNGGIRFTSVVRLFGWGECREVGTQGFHALKLPYDNYKSIPFGKLPIGK
ncbi:hypothetical protein MRX62_00315 [Xylella fastidiosa subsp. pauca]|uniref:VirB4 family type IV secretion/conjugal transfer ATPase n=1 Tax=Xylella fastidiosa TaxID=2371 RepID=UPI003A7276C0